MKRIDNYLNVLHSLGGLPQLNQAEVQNQEWLYMLQEETRQSLSIEGYFSTEEELKAVLRGRKSQPEIFNYYRSAQSNYDLALQYQQETGGAWQKLYLSLPFIKHIHSELFKELDDQRGQLRLGDIRITGAKVKPLSYDIEQYLRSFITLVPQFLKEDHLITALAKTHTLFESIHPFRDGNGRVGRILLNYVAITAGLPPIIIKGTEDQQRQAYYQALEQADEGFHIGFPAPNQLKAVLEQGNFQPLELLLVESVLPQLETMIVLALEKTETLKDFKELSRELGVQESTLRKWRERHKLIAIKRGNRLLSHARLIIN